MTDEEFSGLVEQYQRLILSICHRYVQDFGEAENLTQETFLSAYKHRDSFQGGAYKAWLTKIATNKCLDYLRSPRQKRLEYHPQEELAGFSGEAAPSAELQAANRDTVERIALMCRQLKEPYSSIAQMYYLQELDVKTIASRRQIPLKTVQTQLYRARDKLRKQIQEVFAG